MFARKGTSRRFAQQQQPPPPPSKRPRRSSFPIVNPCCNIEIVETAAEVGAPEKLVSPKPMSTTVSLLTLNEEKSLVEKSRSYTRLDSYQAVNYGSIILQLQEAKHESSNLSDFMLRVFEIVWQSFAMTVFLMFFSTMPVSMVVIGTSYLEECPKEPRIPIYLLVGGAFGIINMCLVLCHQRRSRLYTMMEDVKEDPDGEGDVMRRSNRLTMYMLSAFLVLWFLLGNCWLFSVWKPNFVQPLHEPKNWCSQVLFNFAFYQILACYILAFLVFVAFVGCLISYLIEINKK